MSAMIFDKDGDGNGRAYCKACHWAGSWAPVSAFDPAETLMAHQGHNCADHRAPFPTAPAAMTDTEVAILVGLVVGDVGYHLGNIALQWKREDQDFATFRSQALDKLESEAKRRGLL